MPKKEWWKKNTMGAAMALFRSVVAALASWAEIGVNANKDRKDDEKKLAIKNNTGNDVIVHIEQGMPKLTRIPSDEVSFISVTENQVEVKAKFNENDDFIPLYSIKQGEQDE